MTNDKGLDKSTFGQSSGPASLDSPSLPKLRELCHGIWTVVFEEQELRWKLSFGVIQKTYRDLRANAPQSYRLFSEIYSTAPFALVVILLCTTWLALSEAINFGFLCNVLHLLERDLVRGYVTQADYQLAIFAWFFSEVLGIHTVKLLDEAKCTLRARMKAHFLPKIVKASLRLDIPTMHEKQTHRCHHGHFSYDYPGWDSCERFFTRISNVVASISLMAIILRNVSQKQSPEKEIILTLSLVFPLIDILKPANLDFSCGDAGYYWWTDNRLFMRLGALYDMTFVPFCREYLLLDGFVRRLSSEYDKCTKQLGNVDMVPPDPWNMRQPEYLRLLLKAGYNFPSMILLLNLPPSIMPSNLTSIIFVYQASRALCGRVWQYRAEASTISDIFSGGKNLYEQLEEDSGMVNGKLTYPDPCESSTKGMKLSFQDVAFQYDSESKHAVHGLSFDITPGSLVIVVGTNGSGKSSMLKLLARLYDPSSGHILVDDEPLSSYDIEQVRACMSFLSQGPIVYPLSVRENLTFGLDPSIEVTTEELDHVARLGGAYDFIHRLKDGYDTVIEPASYVVASLEASAFGNVSARLMEEMRSRIQKKAKLSGGEIQRLAASRTILKTKHSNSRLIVVDEATSAMDPIAEQQLVDIFLSMREGKTMLFVTHRFEHLVKKADQILCMKDGAIVGNGTHDTLMDTCEEYTNLYNARSSS